MAFRQIFRRFLTVSKDTSSNIWMNLMIIPAIATYCLFDNYIISISNSQGQSMQPTVKPGDLLIIDSQLKKDDIIVATQPVNPTVNICKRIIQTGGNQVPNKPGIIVPENFYWIEGDNSYKSYDSRHHGCIPKNLIKGKVICVVPI